MLENGQKPLPADEMPLESGEEAESADQDSDGAARILSPYDRNFAFRDPFSS